MKEFANSLRGIKEPRQRVAKLLEYFQTLSSKDIAKTLQFLFEDTSRLPAPLSQIHLDLVRYRNQLEQLGYETMADIYRHAHENSFQEVLLFLRSEKNRFWDEEEKPEGFLKQLSSMTLGARRQLSRKASRQKLELLLFDSDPLVIRELLNNPKVIEKDVVRIGSRHLAPIRVLEEICKSDKWIRSYSVRKALAFNPRTPISYAMGFISKLKINDVKLYSKIRIKQKELCDYAKITLERAQKNKS